MYISSFFIYYTLLSIVPSLESQDKSYILMFIFLF